MVTSDAMARLSPEQAAPPVTSASSSEEQADAPVHNRRNALVAVIITAKGTIKFVLADQKAPLSVANFVKLAESGFYNNLVFHRVEPGVLIQGGDPKGDGTGGPGWTVKGEFSDLPHIATAVGMARTSDPDSAGSQFYICIRDLAMLNGKYAVFGYVIEGMDVVSAIRKGDRMREVRIEEVARDRIPARALGNNNERIAKLGLFRKPVQNRSNIAVSTLDAQNVSAGDAAVIADLLRSRLVRGGVFNVVEKSNMEKILQEQGFQNSGCTNEECAVKLGRILNVQKMIVGSFGKLMNRYFINLRVVDVETGSVVFSDTAKGDTVDDIEVGIGKVADSISNAE